MNVIDTEVVDSHMVSVSIEGADIMPVWRVYSNVSAGHLLPGRVELRWENGELVRMSVYGKRIKKDGTVGNGDSSTQFVVYGKALPENPIPDWLADLVSEHSPESGR